MPSKNVPFDEQNKPKTKRSYTYRSEATKAKALAGLQKGTEAKVAKARENVQSYRESLAQHVRQIGNEELEIRGADGQIQKWKRIDAVVRRLYSDAISGKVAATELIFERGWGKVAAPVQIDLKAEFSQIVQSSGLSWQEIIRDPVMMQIAQAAGMEVVDGEARDMPQLEAPKHE
jgi:hypothetical protein